ncbi:MAG: FG-GAP repeat protein [Deltaproteobacteria bacterium]|nr:FG-GAP repeat protein [Deltaproteobacteria bacterium]
MRSGQARWGLRLSGYGYGEELSSVGTAGPVADRNRVEYRRGALTEWYVNGPQGLEQGFTLESPPARTGGPLTIEVEFSGGFHGAGDEETNAIALTDQGGGRAILRYRGVHAYDADGRDLGAWLEARGSRVLLRVDDTNARYPVVVDPFVQKAKLTAADGAASDFFGVSVAISGDTVVVGAIWDDIGANSDQGSAYVFVKPGGGWADMTQTAKLTAPGDFPTRSRMGLSVGCSRVRLAGVDAGNWREVIEVECVNGHRGSERSRGNQSVEHADAMTETVGCKPARRGARVIGIDVLDGQDRQLLVLPRARAASPQGRSGGMGSSLFRNHKDCGQAGRAPGAMPSLAGSHRWERGLPARRWWRGAGAAVLN